MQLVRRSKTIQQDKLRSLQTCFLANLLQDYYHNLSKYKVKNSNATFPPEHYALYPSSSSQDQLTKLEGMEGFIEVKRDELTHRAIVLTKNRYCITLHIQSPITHVLLFSGSSSGHKKSQMLYLTNFSSVLTEQIQLLDN